MGKGKGGCRNKREKQAVNRSDRKKFLPLKTNDANIEYGRSNSVGLYQRDHCNDGGIHLLVLSGI